MLQLRISNVFLLCFLQISCGAKTKFDSRTKHRISEPAELPSEVFPELSGSINSPVAKVNDKHFVSSRKQEAKMVLKGIKLWLYKQLYLCIYLMNW